MEVISNGCNNCLEVMVYCYLGCLRSFILCGGFSSGRYGDSERKSYLPIYCYVYSTVNLCSIEFVPST